jgi:hypothetical protein
MELPAAVLADDVVADAEAGQHTSSATDSPDSGSFGVDGEGERTGPEQRSQSEDETQPEPSNEAAIALQDLSEELPVFEDEPNTQTQAKEQDRASRAIRRACGR